MENVFVKWRQVRENYEKEKKKAGRRTKGKDLDTSTTAVHSMSYWENSEFTSEYDVDYDDILPNEKKYLI